MSIDWTRLSTQFPVLEGNAREPLAQAEKKNALQTEQVQELADRLAQPSIDAVFRKVANKLEVANEAKNDELAYLLATVLRNIRELEGASSIEVVHSLNQECSKAIGMIKSRMAKIDESLPRGDLEAIVAAQTKKIEKAFASLSKRIVSLSKVAPASDSKWEEFIGRQNRTEWTVLASLAEIYSLLQWLSYVHLQKSLNSDSLLVELSNTPFVRLFQETANYYILRDKEFASYDRIDFAFHYFGNNFKTIHSLLDADEQPSTIAALNRLLYFIALPTLKSKYQSIVDQNTPLKVKGNILFNFSRELRFFLSTHFPLDAVNMLDTVLESKGKQLLVDFSTEMFDDIHNKDVSR